ncbi:MAG: DUF1109 domain-containing protein [Proteobacteria bacterium]|nr:DUF1109 domain-containing protein [Pseudomonadota bacterium]
MKTDDLIDAIVADINTPQVSVNTSAMRALPVGLLVSLVLFLLFLGVRPTFLATWTAVLPKLLVTGALAVSALIVAMRLTRPEPLAVHEYALLLAPVLVLLLLIGLDFAQSGMNGWQSRAIGRNGLYCLTLIPLLSLAPLAGILYAAQCGAVTSHYIAGGIAGLAAAGMGASLYALHCSDDSALFIASWYVPAALLVGAFGAVACKIWVRW